VRNRSFSNERMFSRASRIFFVTPQLLGPAAADPAQFGVANARREPVDDLANQPVLDIEGQWIVQIRRARPDNLAGARHDEFRREPRACPFTPDEAANEVTRAEKFADLMRFHSSVA